MIKENVQKAELQNWSLGLTRQWQAHNKARDRPIVLVTWLQDYHLTSRQSVSIKFTNNQRISSRIGRAMAQAVSRRPFTSEARVRSRVNPCGICGG
jgi:hypothetical protein